jgi:hypothetical protein
LEERVRVLEAETRELRELLDEKNKKIASLSHSQPLPLTQEGSESRKRSHAAMSTNKSAEQIRAPSAKPDASRMPHSPRSPPTKPTASPSDQLQPWSGPTHGFEHSRKLRKAAPARLNTAFEHPCLRDQAPITPSMQSADQVPNSARFRDSIAQQQQQQQQQSLTYPTPRSEVARSPSIVFGLPTSAESAVSGISSSQSLQPERVLYPNMNYIPYGNDSNGAPVFAHSKSDSRLRGWGNFMNDAESEPLTVYNEAFGGPRVDVLLEGSELKPAHSSIMANPSMAMHHASWAYHQFDSDADHSDSVMSFSPDDCLSNGEDLAAEWASASSCHEDGTYNPMMLSEFAHPENTTLDTVLAL